jgi:hypothetical protein
MSRRNRIIDKRVPGEPWRPELTVAQVLEWADIHRKRTGEWPTRDSGKVFGSLDEVWANLDACLRHGHRGLPRNCSIARLLEKHRGQRNRMMLDALTEGKVLRWLDAHHKRTGRWPTKDDGVILDAPGETWAAVAGALYSGARTARHR